MYQSENGVLYYFYYFTITWSRCKMGPRLRSQNPQVLNQTSSQITRKVL